MKVDALGLAEEVRSGHLDAGSPRGTVSWTPLQYACALGDEELARELLVDRKSDPSGCGRTRFGYAPLHVAVRFGHQGIVDLLLAEAAAETARTDDVIGASPLHVAVVQGSLTMVEKLLPFANEITATKNGTTPYELAKRLGHVEIAQLLRNHEQRLRSKQQLGDWLASIGMVEYAPLLHRAGFDDAKFLLLNGLRDATLDAMKIEKEGHRLKLQSLYQLKEFLTGNNGDDDEDDEKDQEEESDGDESDDEGSDMPLDDDSSSSSDDEKDEEEDADDNE